MSHFSLCASRHLRGYPCRLFELLVYPRTRAFPLTGILRKRERRRNVGESFCQWQLVIAPLNTRQHDSTTLCSFGLWTYSCSSLMRAVCCSFSWVAAIKASSRAANSCRAFSASSFPACARSGSEGKYVNLFECTIYYWVYKYQRTWFVLTSSNCWNAQKFQLGICMICICNPFEHDCSKQ